LDIVFVSRKGKTADWNATIRCLLGWAASERGRSRCDQKNVWKDRSMDPCTKWWGWGDPAKHYDLTGRPLFWPQLKEKLDFPDEPFFFPPKFEEVELPQDRLSRSHIDELQKILSEERVVLSREEKLSHTYGKSYHDLVRVRRGVFPEVPDAVLYPQEEEEIERILGWASRNHVAIVPRGGGTSVTGGVEAIRGAAHQGLVVIDLRQLDQVLAIHKRSLLADVQAGILGPALEKRLQDEGLTLSHYLESFEYSTVGGWVAARSAGQQSTLYGKIEDLVESVRLLTPGGTIQTAHLPAAANGPDLARLIVGSEGILGVITQARLRVRPFPDKKLYTGVLFRSFEEGVEAMRRILQSGLKPATLRLSDGAETEFIFSMRKRRGSPQGHVLEMVGLAWLERRGFIPEKRSLVILGLEGSSSRVRWEWREIRNQLAPFSVFYLGERVGQDWYRHRFDNPYLRDLLMDYGILVDTLETSAEWDRIWGLLVAVRKAVLNAYRHLGIKGLITTHLSHMYPTGSSLYFILLASPHVGQELEEWWEIKRAATDAIVGEGGAVSHHHGIGLDHRGWLVHDIGQEGLALLRGLKQRIDPGGILNPRKLLPDPDEGEHHESKRSQHQR
jgi:alkyldihydroxyacetonephosphate synthase